MRETFQRATPSEKPVASEHVMLQNGGCRRIPALLEQGTFRGDARQIIGVALERQVFRHPGASDSACIFGLHKRYADRNSCTCEIN